MAGSSYGDVHESARKLVGKVALITGGASGIGECTARLFVKHGAQVVVADIQDEAGARLCAELGSATASYVRCDVTSEDDVAAAVDHAVARYGKLDVMFNNAGIGGAACHSILESTKADFDRVLAVNLTGPFLGTKHAARVMVAAGPGGCIIGTASLASAVARHGVARVHVRQARAGGADGERGGGAGPPRDPRKTACSPAAAATPLATGYVGLEGEAFEAAMEAVANLKGVRLRVEDIAAAVLFLASDDARYVSGHNLLIDGGCSIVNPSFGIFKD
ncbi:hypothetical protein OsJ_14688 [Oryza sativa Japonica Group]|uniref:Uncharacterized protein n=1 Tax=Oryza sativa subsp. japonica TaxID=39947 RepID=A3ATJ9_ORYSJ|nr:hypothetical protein OsJ_14688 [Oryza sativa Japonica Group]